MSNGKVRYEVIFGVVLLVMGFFTCLLAVAVHAPESLLLALSLACLFGGAVGGYMIGKYTHT